MNDKHRVLNTSFIRMQREQILALQSACPPSISALSYSNVARYASDACMSPAAPSRGADVAEPSHPMLSADSNSVASVLMLPPNAVHTLPAPNKIQHSVSVLKKEAQLLLLIFFLSIFN
jgi:hypothetical protein